MSTKGKHLGGVRTLSDMKARCEEVGECWEWQYGFQNHGRTPCVSYLGLRMAARRLALMLHTGSSLEGMLVMYTCGNKACVNPDHLKSMTKEKAMSKLAAKASTKARNVKIAATKRAQSHVTPSIAHEIRLSTERSDTLAKRHGVSKSTVYAIRRGEKHTTNVWSGLFTGLTGRAA